MWCPGEVSAWRHRRMAGDFLPLPRSDITASPQHSPSPADRDLDPFSYPKRLASSMPRASTFAKPIAKMEWIRELSLPISPPFTTSDVRHLEAAHMTSQLWPQCPTGGLSAYRWASAYRWVSADRWVSGQAYMIYCLSYTVKRSALHREIPTSPSHSTSHSCIYSRL